MKFQPQTSLFQVFFQVEFPVLAPFFGGIFQLSCPRNLGMANPRKELEVFPGFQQCLGWNKALLPCWKFSRILEKREGKRSWNSWREENRTPRTSRVFWESLIPAGFGRNLQIPSKFPHPSCFSLSQSSSLGIFSTQIPQFFPLEVIPGMKFFPKKLDFSRSFPRKS